MIEKYPHGTSTVEETDEFLASRRYIMRLYIDNDTWFTTPIVTLKESKQIYDMWQKPEEFLWQVSFKDSDKRDCVVRANAIIWVDVKNADPVYENSSL